MPLEFEAYSNTSEDYAKVRQPCGFHQILGALAVNATKPLHEQSVIELGSGTGNYVQKVAPKVGQVTGLEYSASMIEQAKKKCGEFQNVSMFQGSALELPKHYKEPTFDGAYCCQVTHHLVQDGKYEPIKQMCKNIRAMLKPGGCMIFNIPTKVQTEDGLWWAALIPKACEALAGRMPSAEYFHTAMEEAGFVNITRSVNLTDYLSAKEYYLTPDGPCHEWYRNCDSTWALSPQEELDAAIEKCKKMNQDGTIHQFLKDREAARERVGQSTWVIGRVPEN